MRKTLPGAHTFLGAILLLLNGCTVAPPPTYKLEWEVADGSRADGFIKMEAYGRASHSYRWSNAEVQEMAAERCRAWGTYKSAELFKKTVKSCVRYYEGTDSCAVWKYKRTYQCTADAESK